MFGNPQGVTPGAIGNRRAWAYPLPNRPGNMASISFCMIVRDEEANLPRSLAPIACYFDEVVVVDTGSTDGTVSLAKQYGAKVSEIAWRNDFSYARNQSIDLASGDWIMWFDADNRIATHDAEKMDNQGFSQSPAPSKSS